MGKTDGDEEGERLEWVYFCLYTENELCFSRSCYGFFFSHWV